MIAFVCAMRREADVVIENMDVDTVFNAFGKDFFVGMINNNKCVVGVSGIGKVNAAITTQYLLDTYKTVDTVVNIGVCGGVKGEVELCGIFVVDKCAQYDFDLSEIDNVKVGQLPDFDSQFLDVFCAKSKALSKVYPVASLVSGDKFSCSQETCDFVAKHFGASLREMEGGAVAQVCKIHQVDCVMVKGVSDFVGPNSNNMYYQTSQMVLDKMNKEINVIINAVTKY